MEILISFAPSITQNNFEGSRLRKSIKGALELSDINYTSSILDDYDIMHLISIEENSKISDANSKSKPIIISCLMCESDVNASYLDFDYNDGKITHTISNKTLKFLNKADRIIVPSEHCKEILLGYDVNPPISVLMPGVNLSRFDLNREDEKEIFYRYFKEEKDKKLVVANGDYDYIEGINTFIEAAKKCPNAIFYFFGQSSSDANCAKQIKKLSKKAPNNCHFKELITDDIYRSALLNASIFMLPCYKNAGIISILEAMAAQCELIIRKQDIIEGFLKDGITAHIASFSETIVALTKDCLDGKIKSTIHDAYEEVKKYSLENIGQQLKQIYSEELKHKGGINND